MCHGMVFVSAMLCHARASAECIKQPCIAAIAMAMTSWKRGRCHPNSTSTLKPKVTVTNDCIAGPSANSLGNTRATEKYCGIAAHQTWPRDPMRKFGILTPVACVFTATTRHPGAHEARANVAHVRRCCGCRLSDLRDRSY